MSTEQIKRLSGAADGVNKIFETPSPFLPGTLRAFRNGVAYEADDDVWGWTELSVTQIEFTTAPMEDTVVQAFYTEIRSEGSPHDPDGVLP